MKKSYKEYLNAITTFIFDVDGVLTNGELFIDNDGNLLRTMNVKDGYAMKIALNAGYHVAIITGGNNDAVKNRLVALGIKDVFLGVHNKIKCYEDYLKVNDINSTQVLYMGDDLPDIPVMKLVGLAACPQDAVAEVKGVSQYISHKEGGKACVRDVIEQVMKVHGKWPTTDELSITSA